MNLDWWVLVVVDILWKILTACHENWQFLSRTFRGNLPKSWRKKLRLMTFSEVGLYLLSWNKLIFSKNMQMMLLFWMSSQPIIFNWMAPHIHWLDKKPSYHSKCLQTFSFYSIFTNLFQLNKYERFCSTTDLLENIFNYLFVAFWFNWFWLLILRFPSFCTDSNSNVFYLSWVMSAAGFKGSVDPSFMSFVTLPTRVISSATLFKLRGCCVAARG